MSVTSVDKNFDNLTLTLIADFDAPVNRVCRTSTTGVVMGTYEPAGELVTGSFALD